MVDRIWEALVAAGHKHQRSKSYSITPHSTPKCIPRLHALPMGYLAACTVLPASLKKTKVTFLETAIIIYLVIIKLRMQESGDVKQKERTQSWYQYASLSIQVIQVQDEDLCHQ